MSKKIVIALDGFSSCGKSTTARHVAAVLHYAFVDSGAMYRAVALYFHRNDISLLDLNQVANALKEIEITFVFNPAKQSSDTYLNGENVENEIRMMFISDMVSQVSALPIVRHAMVALQQKMGEKKGIVMDGRDIGTVVFPKAELKIFMTAEPHIRAQRRKLELLQKGEDLPLEEIVENLRKRDEIDSNRSEGPLKRAEDAIDLDTSFKSMDEQVEFVLEQVRRVQGEIK
jgi:cytidylate kinase